MIELRWALQHRGYMEKERILQYRSAMRVTVEVTNTYENTSYVESEHMEWTDWQDVPEVDVPNVPLPQIGESK